jgi:uncharacterized protein (DUF1778 family)
MEKKTEKLNIRLTPEAKDALRKLAFLEHRTISNLVEFMIFEKGKKTASRDSQQIKTQSRSVSFQPRFLRKCHGIEIKIREGQTLRSFWNRLEGR